MHMFIDKMRTVAVVVIQKNMMMRTT